MEKVIQKTSEKPAIVSLERIRISRNKNEISDNCWKNLRDAEQRGWVSITEYHPTIEITLNPINPASKDIPQTLYHVRHPRDTDSQLSMTQDFYVQRANLQVEPEGISLHDHDAKPAIFTIDKNSIKENDGEIILDPEGLYAIPDEYLDAFIVRPRPGTVVLIERTTQTINQIRKSDWFIFWYKTNCECLACFDIIIRTSTRWVLVLGGRLPGIEPGWPEPQPGVITIIR